jgi:signal transduction histidine kinase
MRNSRSLRNRISISLALFSSTVSIALATIIYLASVDIEDSLIDDTLNAELDDYIARRHRNPQSLPERTATIRAYVVSNNHATPSIPKAVIDLPEGKHSLMLDETRYRAGVRLVGQQKFVVLYDLSHLDKREYQLLLMLIGSVLLVTVTSALVGRWLASRMIAPVTHLAHRVSGMNPTDEPVPLADEFPWIEVRQLAAAFDDYLKRLHDFIERERLFTGDVSHELRTPLAVIEGACELLMQDQHLDEKDHKRLMRIYRSVSEMNMITSALLSLAREKGDIGSHTEVCLCDTVIQEEIDRYSEIFSHKPIQVSLETVAPSGLYLNHAILSMVFGNLLRNAFNYTDQGRIVVRLDKDRISVIDSGPGFDVDDPAHLFKPYTRGDKSSGAGLGLSLAWRLCELQGWRLELSNGVEEGAVAELIFPPATAT